MINDLEIYRQKQLEYQNDLGMLIAIADRYGDTDFLQKMVEEGKLDPLRVSEPEKWNSLHRANIWNPSSPETIRFYINKSVPVNAQDIYGMTPLHYAMRAKNGDAAMVLLEAGADPNIETYEHKSIPLSMIGYIPDRLGILKMMLDKSGDVHHKNKYGETLLESYYPTGLEDEGWLVPVYELMKQYA